jgi:PIN domain nuclease of toxin-antitoxin system
MSSAESAPLLLDTHYWIWFQAGDQEQFAPGILTAIQEGAGAGLLLISVISVWEIGLLESKGRIHLHAPCEQWVKEALAIPGLTLAPLTTEIALDSTRLPGLFHGDPADRIMPPRRVGGTTFDAR